MAGNAVILKHSAQTPLCAERMGEAFAAGGCPSACSSTCTSATMPPPDHRRWPGASVASPAWVAGGHSVQEAAARRFVEVGLELGGKDPAHVRADADLDHAIENSR